MGIPTLISTSTASDSSSIDITSGIDSTYDEYMFVLTDINPATSLADFSFQSSIDSGSSYGVTMTSTYFRAYHREDDGAAALGYDTNRDIAQGTGYQELMSDLSADADSGSSGELHLFSPSTTTYVKHFYARTSCSHLSSGNASARDIFIAGYFNDTNDIDAIQFKMSSGNFDGVIQMYGIS